MEAKGIPLAVAVDGANRHDMKLVKETLENIETKRPKPTCKRPQGLCMDKGYDYDSIRDLVEAFKFTAHIRSRGEEAQAIKQEAGFKARRWVVERTRSWLNRRGSDSSSTKGGGSSFRILSRTHLKNSIIPTI